MEARTGFKPKKAMKQLSFPPALLDDLRQVERLMLERTQTRSAVLGIAGQHLLNSGGKRLRAVLTLLAARLGTYRLEDVIHAAAAVELIHAASLVHDDLVDEAERRRGVITVHSRWDHGVALMVGDYLFALAAGEMALSPDPRVIICFSQAVMTVCEGELSPVMSAMPLEKALEEYFYKIGCKTAALFAAGCKAGIISAEGTAEQIEALGQFGYDLGLAFQIMDDILDFTGDEEILGKPAGSDLRQGVITLPLIYAVEAGGGEKLAAMVDSKDEAEIQWAVDEIRRLGVARAHQEAVITIERALGHLEIFPDSSAQQVLREIAEFVIERDR